MKNRALGRGRARCRRVPDPCDERGQIIPFVAIGMFAFALLVAFVVNIGLWYSDDAGLQKAADLSAVAGAQYYATGGAYDTGAVPGYPCHGATGASLADKALSCASTIAGLNGISGAETATPSIVSVNGNQALKVVATHPNESGLFFSSSRKESATAVVAGIAGAPNAFPATFAQQSWVPNTPVQFDFGTSQAPGAFNLIVACGTGGGSASEQQLITCFTCTQTYSIQNNNLVPNQLPAGCSTVQQLCANSQINSDPGNNLNNHVMDAMNTLSGEVVLIPAYSSFSGSGGNATYTIAGFAELLLDNPAAQQVGMGSNKRIEISGTFVKEIAPTDIQGTCAGTGGDFGATTFYLAG